ncbi:MAG: sulfotransferase family protein [Flavobacteriales bacterium]
MNVLGKIKKAFSMLRATIDKKYARLYYTDVYTKKMQSYGTNVIFEGRTQVSDFRQLIVGDNVVIEKGCHMYSEGGVYISSNQHVKKGTTLPPQCTGWNISVLETSALKKIKPSFVVREPEGNWSYNIPIFFVVSTGRSGTNAIAHFLSKHSGITCPHEAKYLFNRLSTEYAHGWKSREEVKKEIYHAFMNVAHAAGSKGLYGECDLKYSNLIELLSEVFPQAKFIWLIRRADDFVSSAFGRRWFDEYEYVFGVRKEFSPDTNPDDLKIFDYWRLEYSRYRLNGWMTGAVSQETWRQMNCFERNCWYWQYWNALIEKGLESMSASRYIQVKLEELADRRDELFQFLQVTSEHVEVKKTNQAYHATHVRNDWTVEQQAAYKNWCTIGMNKWYGND